MAAVIFLLGNIPTILEFRSKLYSLNVVVTSRAYNEKDTWAIRINDIKEHISLKLIFFIKTEIII